VRPLDVVPGRTYVGGKSGESRTVVKFGASQEWVCWAPTKERLPHGGFVNTRCTSRDSFARWAESEVVDAPAARTGAQA
jgi:hypothetical protein